MSQTKRILVVVGTRPEAIKMAPVIHALGQQSWAEVRVLCTAQHRQMLDQVLEVFDIQPDLDLDLMRADQSLDELTARLISSLGPALDAEGPDLVLVQGDTTTVMAAALTSFYRDIPVGHVEAGLRSGDLQNPYPEEMNRKLVTRLSSLHFAPTPGAADNLRQEGVTSNVHVTGNTVIDALLWTSQRVGASPFSSPQEKKRVLATAHRRESFGEPFAAICAAIREIADRGDVEVLFPVHPNPRVRDDAHRILEDHPAVNLCDPLGYADMVAAMRACDVILTDSGGVQEEAPSLGKPVLVLRATTERPEGVAAGCARLVGTEQAQIVAATNELLDDTTAIEAMTAADSPYGDGRAAPRIVAHCRAFLDAPRCV